MANHEHLEILKQGVEIWNKWRKGQPVTVLPDLSGADLEGRDLSEPYPEGFTNGFTNPLGINLRSANLSGVNLSGADLSGAFLNGADLSGANLRGVRLSTIRRNFNLHHARWGRDIRQGIQPLEYIFADLAGSCLKRANLRDINLRDIDMSGADLSETHLEGVNFSDTILVGANLTSANLQGVDLTNVNFRKARLTNASLGKATLTGADLQEATLTGASLIQTLLVETKLTNADLTKAQMGGTHIDNLDLRFVRGLELVEHRWPSHIGIDTIYRSKGNIPDVFLKGAGVPESFLTNMHALVESMSPIDFYSCFISYSSKDENFAKRLYADLQNKGVRCWFAPEDMKTGDVIRSRIDEAIQVYDKLLLVLSRHSVESSWVEKEVETAFEKERQHKRHVLFPVRLDDVVMGTSTSWAADIRRMRHITDFTHWKSHDTYQKAFARLLHDLKAET